MSVTVRRLYADDWKLGREIRLRALLDAPASFFRSYDQEVGLAEDVWRGRLANTERVSLVAELDGRAVGLVGAGPASVDERDDQAALMVSMWVEPESRGAGIADALTAALIDWCREQGYQRLLLWVYDDAPRAAAFYRKAGFAATGRTETFGDDTRRLALMTMTLTTRPAVSS